VTDSLEVMNLYVSENIGGGGWGGGMYYLTAYMLRHTGSAGTPWRSVLLEKLTCLELVKKFLAFYGTRRFITAFTTARHLFPFHEDPSYQTSRPLFVA